MGKLLWPLDAKNWLIWKDPDAEKGWRREKRKTETQRQAVSNVGKQQDTRYPTQVSDVIHPSHPLSSSSPPAPNPSQNWSLFQWVNCTGVSALASFLPKNTQGSSPLEWTGWISLQSKGLSRVFSNTTVQKHRFFGTQPSSQPNCQIHTWTLEKP